MEGLKLIFHSRSIDSFQNDLLFVIFTYRSHHGEEHLCAIVSGTCDCLFAQVEEWRHSDAGSSLACWLNCHRVWRVEWQILFVQSKENFHFYAEQLVFRFASEFPVLPARYISTATGPVNKCLIKVFLTKATIQALFLCITTEPRHVVLRCNYCYLFLSCIDFSPAEVLNCVLYLTTTPCVGKH